MCWVVSAPMLAGRRSARSQARTHAREQRHIVELALDWPRLARSLGKLERCIEQVLGIEVEPYGVRDRVARPKVQAEPRARVVIELIGEIGTEAEQVLADVVGGHS